MPNQSLGVLITYYNERELLTECLESLRAQSQPVDEILIYDDASEHPADPYIPTGLDVRIFRGETNIGPARGRNMLLSESRSECIHFHDSDDLFLPQWSSEVRKRLAEDSVDAVFTEISFVGEDGLNVHERVMGLEALRGGEDLTRFCLRGCILPAGGTYKRTNVSAIGGYRENLWQSEDFDFHVRLAASGIGYRIIENPLIMCRSRAAGRSKRQIEVYTSAQQAIEMLAEELPVRYHRDLAERAAGVGSTLFQLGAHVEARAAFRLAYELGPPRLADRRTLYRTISRMFGLEFAEWTGSLYRRTVPRPIREALASQRT